MKIQKEHMSPDDQEKSLDTNVECQVCLDLLIPRDDGDKYPECIQCEKVFCSSCSKKLEKCPLCSYDEKRVFKPQLSRLRKQELLKVTYRCPNYDSCQQILPLLQADEHIQQCNIIEQSNEKARAFKAKVDRRRIAQKFLDQFSPQMKKILNDRPSFNSNKNYLPVLAWERLGSIDLEFLNSVSPIDFSSDLKFQRLQMISGHLHVQSRNNLAEGIGRAVYGKTNNSIYEGQFKNGKYHGYGRFIFQNGTYYQGFFRNNAKNGYGQDFDATGQLTQEGYYEKGFLQDIIKCKTL